MQGSGLLPYVLRIHDAADADGDGVPDGCAPADDTAEPSIGDTTSTGEDGDPTEPSGDDDPTAPTQAGCGCDSGPGAGTGAWAIAAWAVVIGRRRRRDAQQLRFEGAVSTAR